MILNRPQLCISGRRHGSYGDVLTPKLDPSAFLAVTDQRQIWSEYSAILRSVGRAYARGLCLHKRLGGWICKLVDMLVVTRI